MGGGLGDLDDMKIVQNTEVVQILSLLISEKMRRARAESQLHRET